MIPRDLELSTSLDLQAIDSKVENLAVEHASSQNANANHLERIQQDVQSVGAVQHITHETTLGISRSTVKIHDTLQDIQTSQASSHHTTRCQLESLDARIAAMQRSILNIPHHKGVKPRRRVRKPDPRRHVSQEHAFLGAYSELEQRTPNPPAVPTQLNKVVDIAVTARLRCGKWHLEAFAIPDTAFEAANFGTRLRMVKYLQDLRLLLWLLCRKECIRDRLLNPSSLPRSELISESRLVSSWNISTIFDITARVFLMSLIYVHKHHKVVPHRLLMRQRIYEAFHMYILQDDVGQARTNAIPLVTTTAALLSSVNKWLDRTLESIRFMENLMTKWQLTRQEFLMGIEDELKSRKSLVFMMEVVKRALFKEACVNERKRKDTLSLEEFFDSSLRRRFLAMGILQEPEHLQALAHSLPESAWP